LNFPYDPDWEYGEEPPVVKKTKVRDKRKKRPVHPLYTKTRLIEKHNAVLGEGCGVIVVE
jgi:hypothetical protein